MADDFGVVVQGERQVRLMFEQLPQHARAQLLAAITSLTDRLYARVVAATPERTGRLRGEITERVVQGENYIRGTVSVRVGPGEQSGLEAGKAAALEYGAHRAVSVVSYSRRHDHVYAHAITPIRVMVEAYQRTANIAERRYLRGPLDDMRGDIVSELRAAVEAAGKAAEAAAA